MAAGKYDIHAPQVAAQASHRRVEAFTGRPICSKNVQTVIGHALKAVKVLEVRTKHLLQAPTARIRIGPDGKPPGCRRYIIVESEEYVNWVES